MKNITISDIIKQSDRLHIIRENFHENGLDITVEYPAIFRSAKVLRDFIIDMADFFHFKSTWKSRLTLIADELNNNGIEYGSREKDVNKMIIRTVIKGDRVDLILEVEDTGKGKLAKKASEMDELRAKKSKKKFEDYTGIRGRGLFLIIDKLVDELYFRDSKKGGLIVGIRKKVEIETPLDIL